MKLKTRSCVVSWLEDTAVGGWPESMCAGRTKLGGVVAAHLDVQFRHWLRLVTVRNGERPEDLVLLVLQQAVLLPNVCLIAHSAMERQRKMIIPVDAADHRLLTQQRDAIDRENRSISNRARRRLQTSNRQSKARTYTHAHHFLYNACFHLVFLHSHGPTCVTHIFCSLLDRDV